jgi:hypothetical protein
VTAPDRLTLLAAQDAWAAGKAYRPEPAEDRRVHADEIRGAHGCVPSPEAAVNMGVTPSSGEGSGPWPRRPV